MSVRGEFQRILMDCLTLLEQSSASDRALLAGELAEANARTDDDLSAGARMALDAMARCDPSAPRFAKTDDREAFDSRIEHLRAICRAILGP